jgi:hypothetical protein
MDEWRFFEFASRGGGRTSAVICDILPTRIGEHHCARDMVMDTTPIVAEDESLVDQEEQAPGRRCDNIRNEDS